MKCVRIYGASFLEALAIYICQTHPEGLWLTLGPRETIIKQIVESLCPALEVKMIPAQQAAQIRFERSSAYILAVQADHFQGLLKSVQISPAGVLVLFCSDPKRLKSKFKEAGIRTKVLRSCSDLAKPVQDAARTLPAIFLTTPEAAKSASNIVVNWVPGCETKAELNTASEEGS